MKTQLPEKSLFNTLKLKLIFLILFSLSLKSANALLSSYGLSAPTATLDPMSGGTITTLVAANQNDLASAVTSIGFTFTLNSVSYTQFSVNSNGLMRLGSTVVTSTAANSLASSTDLPKIAAYWDDLKTVAGTVRSKVLGISPSRTLVVDWNVTIVNTNTTAQFQVWLFEGTNNIQFVYGAGTATNAGLYSVGLATSTTDFSSITVASTFGSSTVSTVTANNSNSQTIGASNSFLYTPAPTCPVLTSPASNATNVSKTPTLTWTAGTTGTTTLYDVYFGTAASPPLVSANQAGTSYSPPTLLNNTVYFWKVIGKNGTIAVASSASCSTIQFTTLPVPNCATSQSPTHLSTNKALNTTLSWVAGAGTVPTGYDVYFGTAVSPPLVSTNQAGTTYNPGTLISNTNYYWKIVPRNGSDLATGCTISQFTTVPLPSCAASLSPAHLATLQPLTTSLTWTAGAGTVPTGYDVYFGTAVNPPLVSTNQAGTSFNPGALISSTNYYWKIVPRNGSELATGCAVSQFTTVPIPNCATGFNPAHLTTNLPLQDTLKWTAGAGTAPTGYDIYFGTAANPPLVATNNLTTSYFPGYLSFNTTYYWKIVPRNGADLATGCSINQFSTRLRLSFDVTRTKGIAYSSISSTGLSVPAASWRNGTVTDDNLSNALPIGFNFTYNGGTYSNFLLGVNGFITLNTATTSNGAVSAPYGYNNGNLSGGSPTSPLVIAPFYEDITCQGQQSNLLSNLDNSIKYKTTGSVGSRVLTVEWIGMETFNTAGPNLNFQLKIYEGTNIIEFIYGNMDGFDGTFNLVYSYSVGISASAVSTTPQNGEFFDQDTANTRSFGSIAASQLTGIPECYSRIRLTPGNYTPYSFVSLKPTNDSLGTPIHLNVNATPCIDLCGTYYKTNGATKSRDATCGGTPDDDVWFDFTAINANTTIKVAGSGGFDAVSELFNNSMVSLACANTSAVNGLGLTETITSSSLVVGQKYFVRVFHKNSGYGAPGSGEFSICVSGVPSPPINDNCSNSITLPISPSYTIGTNTYAATASSGIPSCGLPNGENPDDDVWYKFTAAKSIEVITVAGGNGFDAVIQLLSGTCNGLSSLSCVNNFGNGQVETMTVSGLTINAVYFVRVFHKGIGGGSGSFSISVSSPPPSCSDLVLPPNGELNMSASGIDLIWDPVIGADNYIVKFDTIYPPVRVLTTTTDTTVYTGILKQTKTYYWQLIPGNGNSYNYTCEKDSFSTEETPVKLTVRVFLQNLYLTNRTMKNLINPADTIADTIVITLYDAINEFQYASIAFLSTNGWAAGYFPLLALDSPYYFVVSHRNSVETWSSTMFMMTGDSTFDFSSSPSAVWGGNVVQVQAGVYAMICGDMNQDGYIDKLDVGIVGDSAALFQTGFVTADFNADSIVESLDLSQLENKVPLLIKKRTPFPPFGP